jgi:hypothetical protein
MLPRFSILPVVAGLLAAWAAPVCAQNSPAKLVGLSVDPPSITLRHADDRHRVIVSGKLADGSVRDYTGQVKYASAQPAVARVSEAGVVTPLAVGQTSIEVSAGEAAAVVPVSVTDIAQRPVRFTNDVIPLFFNH